MYTFFPMAHEGKGHETETKIVDSELDTLGIGSLETDKLNKQMSLG